jgi:hypothetical protein
VRVGSPILRSTAASSKGRCGGGNTFPFKHLHTAAGALSFAVVYPFWKAVPRERSGSVEELVTTDRLDTARGPKDGKGIKGIAATVVGRRAKATKATRGATAAARQVWKREAHFREDLAGVERPSPYPLLEVVQEAVKQTAEWVERAPLGSSIHPVRGSKPRGSGVSQRQFS